MPSYVPLLSVIRGFVWQVVCCASSPSPYLGPSQFGINKKGGSEIIVHSAQLMKDYMFSQGNSDHGILTLDCSNAFNSIRRSFIGTGIMASCPVSLATSIGHTIDSPVSLNSSLGVHCVDSCSGGRQGDPLGPLLFCLGTSHAFNKTAQDFVVRAGMSAFLDDITSMGPNAELIKAFKSIQRRFATLGLQFNPVKSALFTPSTTFDTGDTRIPVVNDGVQVLGIPIGTERYVQASLDKLLTQQTAILEKLPIFPVPERVPILRSSVNARPMYHMRNTPPSQTEEFSREFDSRVLTSLCSMLNMDPADFPATSAEVKHLPTHHGGLGITSMSRVRNRAYVASLIESLRYLKEKCPWTFDKVSTFRQFPPELRSLLPSPPPANLASEFHSGLIR